MLHTLTTAASAASVAGRDATGAVLAPVAPINLPVLAVAAVWIAPTSLVVRLAVVAIARPPSFVVDASHERRFAAALGPPARSHTAVCAKPLVLVAGRLAPCVACAEYPV